MMNREDTATSHVMSVRDDLRRQEVAKIAKRVNQTGKTAKPTLEIYRPPKTNLRNGGGKVVHFQMTGSIKGASPTTELKSALKRSKSFGGNDVMETAAVSFERDAFPLEYHGLIRRALHDPNSLSSRQLMELVRLICSKAVESLQNAEHSAQMCFTIIEKENGDTFLESLLNSCREWYNERDKLLRSSFSTSSSTVTTQFGGGSKRWTAYISFLTGLYLRLKSQHHQSVHRAAHSAKNAGDSSGSTSPTPAVAHQTLALLRLLYECSQIILKPPSLNSVVEIVSSLNVDNNWTTVRERCSTTYAANCYTTQRCFYQSVHIVTDTKDYFGTSGAPCQPVAIRSPPVHVLLSIHKC